MAQADARQDNQDHDRRVREAVFLVRNQGMGDHDSERYYGQQGHAAGSEPDQIQHGQKRHEPNQQEL